MWMGCGVRPTLATLACPAGVKGTRGFDIMWVGRFGEKVWIRSRSFAERVRSSIAVVVVVVVMLWLWLWLWFRVEGMGRGCFLSGGDIYFFGWRDNKRLDRIWACLHAQITTLGMLQVPHSA